FAPFATRRRRGYVRDSSERDLAVHLETALRGVIIGDRWPKSGVEVVVTVLEGEEDRWCGDAAGGSAEGAEGWGMMTVLAGCITAASAAIAHAGIDCVDLVSGGVAAITSTSEEAQCVLDPSPAEHPKIHAACVVGYLASRDEVTELWLKGDLPAADKAPGASGSGIDDLINHAVQAAMGSGSVLEEAVKEGALLKTGASDKKAETETDTEMAG
ncbi:MAG: 3'-5'-exoribonuclease, partial [Thelocarpon impressellum]